MSPITKYIILLALTTTCYTQDDLTQLLRGSEIISNLSVPPINEEISTTDELQTENADVSTVTVATKDLGLIDNINKTEKESTKIVEDEKETSIDTSEESSLDINELNDTGIVTAANLSEDAESSGEYEDIVHTDMVNTETTTENIKNEIEDTKPTTKPETASRSPKSGLTHHHALLQAPLKANVTKSSTLKNWLQDPYLRSPPGLLVPLRSAALQKALNVWTEIEGYLNLTDIVLIGYDSKGINWRSRHNLQGKNGHQSVTDAFKKLIVKYQGMTTKEQSGDATMRALASASKLVPYDSGIFIVTDKGAYDTELLSTALKSLIQKRLKVYTIWTDPHHPSPESEVTLQELKNISLHTEGDILTYFIKDSLLLVKRSAGGAVSIGLPVEAGVTGLRVFIEGMVDHAVLYPPNDASQIDLYNTTSVQNFSALSRTDSENPRDNYLIFSDKRPDTDMLTVVPMRDGTHNAVSKYTGNWHFSVRCDTCDYRVTVTAYSNIHFDAQLVKNDTLSIHLVGPVSSVRETSLVDEYGNQIQKLPFSYQPSRKIGENPLLLEPAKDIETKIPYPVINASKIYVRIVGKDTEGASYVRLSGPLHRPRVARSTITFPDTGNELEAVEEYNLDEISSRSVNASYNTNRNTAMVINQSGVILTTVQIGLSTKIYGEAGDILQLHFEVTNYREQAVAFRFEAIGVLRFLRSIQPSAQIIPSGTTVNVIVTAGITTSAAVGARDEITFTAYGAGLDQVSISTFIYVTDGYQTSDTWAPALSHNFEGSCLMRLGDDCNQYTWAARVSARDRDGGLLRLTSVPMGVMYDNAFVAGTKEEVLATYRATCCNPRVVVTAVDAFGNANGYTIDISYYFTPATIASITLAVFLLIALILIIAFLIYWCVRRRKESRELPYTASRRETN